MLFYITFESQVKCLQLAKARLLERGMSPDTELQGHEGLWCLGAVGPWVRVDNATGNTSENGEEN